MEASSHISTSALAGRTFWLTRPRYQLSGLQARIEAAGGRVVALPMFEIEALDYGPELKQRILNLDQYDLLFFISTNAATLGMECINHFWPQLPARQQYFSVGPTTAQVLESFDLEVHYPRQRMNSEALLALPALQDVEGRKALIFRGVGGREILAQGLRDKGVSVDYAEVYTRSVPEYSRAFLEKCVTASPPDAIVISSSEALANMVALFRGLWPDLLQAPLFVSSSRLLQDARAYGFTAVRDMQGANDEAIMNSLMTLGPLQESN